MAQGTTTGKFPREERKVVTAVFADLVGSTSLAERFDPEDVVEIVGRAVSRMVEVVEEFGGTVKDLAGDGLLALFGAPEAHEDDPERAVRAALRIVEVIRAHAADVQRAWGVQRFGVRVGIDTGLAVLGPVGGGSRVEYGATGDALNTAARLQSQAETFAVLVGSRTHRLIEPIFRWGHPRELLLKGKAEALLVYEVAGLRAVPGKPRGLATVTTPLLGRDAELRIARDTGQAVHEGRGGILFVIGEPGIGKTRLLAELRQLVFAEGSVTWLEGRCVSYGQALPYWPFRDLLGGWLGANVIEGSDRPGVDLFERCIVLFEGRAREIHPYLAAMLGLPLDPVAERELAALSPEARQFRTTEAVRMLIRRLAEERPVIIAIEDLHWVDASSMQLLERLLPLTDSARAMIVVSHRPEVDHSSWHLHLDATRDHPDRTRVLTLDALSPGAERSLLETLVGVATLPRDLEDRILASAEGNPFYLEELIRSLIDDGALAPEGAGWRFEGSSAVEIPPSVERVIISRIDRLSTAARETIQAASVLGRRFDRPLLEAVAGGDGALTDALGELVLFDLIGDEGSSGYSFKHALIQEAAYNNMLKRRRRELHALAAEALESLLGGRPEPDYGLLAQHYRGAGRPEEALRYFELAAAGAKSVYAVGAALENYTAAVEIAESLGSGRTGELRLHRGRVRSQIGDFARARVDFEVALAAAREEADRGLEVEATNELGFLLAGTVNYGDALPLLEGSLAASEGMELREAQVAAASRLSIVYTNLLRLDLAVDRARRALTLARDIGEEGSLAMSLDALQVTSVMVGDMATVGEISPELVEIHRRRGDLWYLQLALFQWAWVEVAAGRWDQAEGLLTEGLAVNRQIGDQGNEPIFPAALTWIARAQGQYGRSIELGRRAIELSSGVGHPEFLSWAAGVLGWTLLEVFADSEAVEQIERSLRAAEEAGARIVMIRAACHLPLARWRAGDRGRALEEATSAEQLLREVTAPPSRAFLWGADGPIALANLYVDAGDPSRALDLVGTVFDAALAAEWHEVVGAAALASGRARARMGDMAGAREALETAVQRAERFLIPGLAWRAHAELAMVGPRNARALHDARAGGLVGGLSRSIEDASMRRTFLEAAAAELSGGGRDEGQRHPSRDASEPGP